MISRILLIGVLMPIQLQATSLQTFLNEALNDSVHLIQIQQEKQKIEDAAQVRRRNFWELESELEQQSSSENRLELMLQKNLGASSVEEAGFMLAQSQLKAEMARLDQKRRETILRIGTSGVAYVQAVRNRSTLQKMFRALKDGLEILKRRVAAGVASPHQMDLLQVRIQSLEQKIAQAQIEESQRSLEAKFLSGHETLPTNLEFSEPTLEFRLNDHPHLQEIDMRLGALEARHAKARREYGGGFQLGAGIGLSPGSSQEREVLFKAAWQLPHNRGLQSEKQSLQSLRSYLEVSRQKRQTYLKYEQDRIQQEYQQRQQQIQNHLKAMETSTELMKRLETAYQSGQVALLEWLEGSREHLTLELSLQAIRTRMALLQLQNQVLRGGF